MKQFNVFVKIKMQHTTKKDIISFTHKVAQELKKQNYIPAKKDEHLIMSFSEKNENPFNEFNTSFALTYSNEKDAELKSSIDLCDRVQINNFVIEIFSSNEFENIKLNLEPLKEICKDFTGEMNILFMQDFLE